MKKIFITLFISFFIISITPQNADAFITLDPTRGVGKVFKSVSDFAADVQAKITDLQNQVLGNKWVAGAINEAKKAKATMDAAMKKYQKIMAGIRQLHSDIDGIMNSNLVKMATLTGKIAKLNREIKSLEQESEVEEQSSTLESMAQNAILTGKRDALIANNAVYTQTSDEESAAIIEENNRLIQELNQQINQASASPNPPSENYTRVNQKIESLKREKESLENELRELSKMVGLKFLSDVEAYTLSMDVNFIRADEPETAEAIEKIRRGRQEEYQKVLKDSYSRIIVLRDMLPDDIANVETLAAENDGMEAVDANIQGITQIKAANIRSLMLQAELLLHDMKIFTAREYANLNIYKMENSDKDMTAFRLEDYIFDYDKYKIAQAKKRSLTLGEIKAGIINNSNKGKDILDKIEDKVNNPSKDLDNLVDDIVYDSNRKPYNKGQNELDKALESTGGVIRGFEGVSKTGQSQLDDLLN